AGDLAGDQLLGERLVRGEVQVGEQGLAVAHAVVLLRNRLLDLEHHVRGTPDLVGAVEDLRPGCLELTVLDLRAESRVPLHVDVVTVSRELVYADGRDGHPVLVVLDFLGDADLHRSLLVLGPWAGALWIVSANTSVTPPGRPRIRRRAACAARCGTSASRG